MAEFEVTGLSDLWAKMQDIPVKIETNILRGGLRAGAIPIQQEARRLVNSVSGDLAKSIRVTTKVKRGTVYSLVIAGKHKKPTDPYYAHMVEFGTAAHWIRPKKLGGALFWKGHPLAQGVLHPGAQKKPFMRPAMDGKAQQALEAMADYMAERLPNEIAKLA